MDLSIIVPVYNVEKYLKRCIESLLTQENLKYEIILVDDGSTDSSYKICDTYADKYDIITTYQKENEGLGLTRNYGLHKAKGKYILFVDSDDYIENNSLLYLVDYIKENDMDVVFFGRNKDLEGNIIVGTDVFPKDLPDYRKLTSLCLGEPLKKDSFEIGPAWKAIYNKDFITKNKIYFESERIILSEDYIFSAKVCLNQPKVGFWKRNIYYYCDNGGSLTNSYNPNRARGAINLYKTMEKLINTEKLGNDATLRAYNNFMINLLVSFKHLVLNGDMEFNKKIRNIKEICCEKKIREILKKKNKLENVKLKVLRNLIISHNYIFIYILIKYKYNRSKNA